MHEGKSFVHDYNFSGWLCGLQLSDLSHIFIRFLEKSSKMAFL